MKEQWRDVPGFPGYQVSDLGCVFSMKLNGLMSQSKDSKGYMRISLKNCDGYRKFGVHRLVLLAFEGEPQPEQNCCRHLNGVRDDNRLVNLSYGTLEENWADRRVHGTASVGEAHHNSKLTEQKVKDIRKRAARGETYVQIAKGYSVTPDAVGAVVRRVNWRHV